MYWQSTYRRFTALTVAGLWLSTASCAKTPETVPEETQTAEATKRSDDQLQTIFGLVHPEVLGLGIGESQTDPRMVVDLLNQWRRTSAPQQSEGEPSEQTLVEQVPVAGLWTAVTGEMFTERDVTHLRDQYLFRQTVDHVLADRAEELAQVVTLFYHTVDSLQLVDQHEKNIPLIPYTIVMLAQGTAEDRAWIFASLLRQQKLDAVILELGDDGKNYWCVGVPLNGQVYLFDTRAGLPLQASAEIVGDTPRPRQPATLAELLQQQTPVNAAFPVKSGDGEKLAAQLVSDSDFWSKRMQSLQKELSGNRSVEIFDRLSSGPEGLPARVLKQAGGQLRGDQLGVWAYPEQQLAAFEANRQEDRSVLLERWDAFLAPYQVEGANQATRELIFGGPQRTYFQARTDHLLGNYEAAVRGYTSVRYESNFPDDALIPERMERIHAVATEDTLFLDGLAKYQLGDFDGALSSFTAMLDHYAGRNGRWAHPSQKLQALCYAQLKDYATALEELRLVPADSPTAAGNDQLAARWEKLAGQ